MKALATGLVNEFLTLAGVTGGLRDMGYVRNVVIVKAVLELKRYLHK